MSGRTSGPGEAVDTALDWSAVTSAALLGTDRRTPPEPNATALADLLADARSHGAATEPAEALVVVTAGLAAVRRAGTIPGAVLGVEPSPPVDHRPVLSPAAAARWHEVVDEWPVLEDELLLRTVEAGWRLPPDVLVAMLRRHRGDSARRRLVLAAAGPLAAWSIARFAGLAATSRRRTDGTGEWEPRLPELPIPATLAGLLAADQVDAFDELLADLRAGRVAAAHRAVLVNLCARVRPSVLVPLADTFTTVEPSQPTTGLALALAHLCRTRAAMLEELA